MHAYLTLCLVVSANAVTLNSDDPHIRRLDPASRTTALKLMHEEEALYSKQGVLRKVETQRMTEWLKSETVRHITEAATLATSGGKSAGMYVKPQKQVMDAVIEGGQEDSFDLDSARWRKELLNSASAFVIDAQLIIQNFAKTTQSASANVSVPMIARLFEQLHSKLQSQQSLTMSIVQKLKQKLPEALKPVLAPMIEHIHESADPFNVHNQVWADGKNKQSLCDGVSIVKAGFKPYFVNLREAHMALNSTALLLAEANHTPKAFLLPRLASMGYFEVLALQNVGVNFMENAMPIIEEKIACGPSSGHVLETHLMTEKELRQERKRKANESAALLHTIIEDAYAHASEKGRLSDIDGMKQALLNYAPSNEDIEQLEQNAVTLKNKFIAKMAYYDADSRAAAQDLVVAATNSTTDIALIRAFANFFDRVEELWKVEASDAASARFHIPRLLAKGMRPHTAQYLDLPVANHSMFFLDAASRAKEVKVLAKQRLLKKACEVVDPAVARAVNYRTTILSSLKALDELAFTAKTVHTFPHGRVFKTVLPDMMRVAYAEALTLRDVIKDTLQIVGPVIVVKLQCGGVHDMLEKEWWYRQRAVANK